MSKNTNTKQPKQFAVTITQDGSDALIAIRADSEEEARFFARFLDTYSPFRVKMETLVEIDACDSHENDDLCTADAPVDEDNS